MSDALIPVWIIGGPFVALLILAFSFRGPSSMSGPGLANRRFYGDRMISGSGFDWDTAHGQTYGQRRYSGTLLPIYRDARAIPARASGPGASSLIARHPLRGARQDSYISRSPRGAMRPRGGANHTHSRRLIDGYETCQDAR